MITFFKKEKKTQIFPFTLHATVCRDIVAFMKEFSSLVMRANHVTSLKLVILKLAAHTNQPGEYL